MIFKEALAAMQEGKKVKCPEWLGFWQMKNGKIMMHCKDGNVINLTDTEDIIYTLSLVYQVQYILYIIIYIIIIIILTVYKYNYKLRYKLSITIFYSTGKHEKTAVFVKCNTAVL